MTLQVQDDSQLNYTVRLMEQLVVATFVVDADCRVVIWNRACERLTGLKRDDLIGKLLLEVLPGTERSWIESDEGWRSLPH